MKNVSFILLLAMAVLFVSSCEKGKEDPLPTHGVMLYKYKNPEYRFLCYKGTTYSGKDCYPSYQDTLYENSYALKNGYFIDEDAGLIEPKDKGKVYYSAETFGEKTIILDVKRTDWWKGVGEGNILDDDPISEMYFCRPANMPDSLKLKDGQVDTIKFNSFIIKGMDFGKIGFKRIK